MTDNTGAPAESDADRKHHPPPDEGSAAYLIFFLLGAGFLFPWNAFVTGVDYFDALYPGRHIDRVFTTAYMVPNLGSLSLLVLYGHQTTSRARIKWGFWAMLLVIAAIPAMDAALAGRGGTPATLAFTVAAVAAAGAVDACLQGSLYGTAGGLPERYTQAIVGGTAASGVIVNALRIATKAALPDTQAGLRISADLYFGVSAAFIALCIVGFDCLERLPVIRYYRSLRGGGAEALPFVRSSSEGPDGGGDAAVVDVVEVSLGKPAGEEEEDKVSGLGHGGDAAEATEAEEGAGAEEGGKRSLVEPLFSSQANLFLGHAMSLAREHTDVTYIDVAADVWPHCAALTLVYVVTLSIFPGFLSEDVHSRALGDWYPLALMTVYNVADLAGKTVPAFRAVPRRTALLVAGSAARLGFYPLFALCVWGPYWLRTEVPVVALTAALGFSNGYVTTVLMMVTPKVVSEDKAEVAGVLMVLFLVVGLFLGSFAGWLWLL